MCWPAFRLAALVAFAADMGFAAGDAILQRAWVPNSWVPQGEIRLIQRDQQAVVQSVLWTRHLGLVADHIAGRERDGWGDDPSAAAYVAALRACVADVMKGESPSGPRALAIDFIAGPQGEQVVFSRPQVRKGESGLELDEGPVLRRMQLPAAYVRRNQYRILDDAFGRQVGAASNALAKLLQDNPHAEAAHER